MPQDKLAFVGAKKGELTLMVGPNGIHMGIDLAMPNLAPFVIQAPLDGEGPLELLFVDLIESLTGLVQGYLEAQGVDTEILDALTKNIKGAVSALDHRYTEQRYSENGSGVLDTVRGLETETLFEAEFDLPEGFLQQAHTKVVTAAVGDITQSPAFKAWFAGSKVVDKAGRPLRCVHGTPHEFDTFREAEDGLWFSSVDDPTYAEIAILDEGSMNGLPSVPSADPDLEPSYPVGARMMVVYLNAKNPKVMGGMDGGDYPDVTKLRRAGHDGCLYLGSNGEIESVVVFSPSQVKSALSSGFNPNDARITANAAIVRRTPQFQPKAVKTGPQTSILQRPTPSLKNIIQKYRTQQGKPLSGPLFVLVYDSCGRPVGVRSVQGPGWSQGGKIASPVEADPPFSLITLKGSEEHPAPEGSTVSDCTRRECTQCGENNRCRCMSKFHDPDDPSFRGAIKVEHILCDGCAQEKLKLASKDTITLKNWRQTPEEVDVYINPSRTEFKGTCMKDSHVARAFVFPRQNKVVAWAGYAAIHDDIAKDYLPLLGLSPRDGIAIEAHSDSDLTISDYSRNSSYFHDPKAAEVLENCPALLAAMGGYISFVTYFDEERVGDWTELEAPSVSVEAPASGSKTSSAASFQRTVVARDSGAIVGVLRFADYPHDRRILVAHVGMPGLLGRMIRAMGDDKPIFAMNQTNEDLSDLLSGIATKTSRKYFENEGLEELGFKPVGNQLVKAAGPAAATLQPDTVLQVFTGCSHEDATRYCAEGIDTEHAPSYQRYPHTDLGLPVHGLIVTSDPHDATGLGPIVLQLKVAADALHDLHPSQEADLDESNREQFPDSFRPSLSWVLTQERRALFMGAVAPQAIQAIERIRR